MTTPRNGPPTAQQLGRAHEAYEAARADTAPAVGYVVDALHERAHGRPYVNLIVQVPEAEYDHLLDALAVTVAPQLAPGPLADAIQRVAAHLDRYATMAGPTHPDIIHAFTDSQLTVQDLRTLLAAVGTVTGPPAGPAQDGGPTPVVGTLVSVSADGQDLELTVRVPADTDCDHLFDAPAVTVAPHPAPTNPTGDPR